MRRQQVKWKLDPALLAEFRRICAEQELPAARVIEALMRFFLRLRPRL